MKVLIIAGHGQGDPGACGCGYKEADLTREIASALSHYEGVTVYDMNKDLYQQQSAGNRFDFTPYDYVLELHFNAGGGTGSEILVRSGTTYSERFAESVLNGIVSLGFNNRGMKGRSDLYNMNACYSQGVPYALLEICFIDNQNDINLYQKNKDKIVSAIAAAFNLKTEGLTMDQYKELLAKIEALTPQVYNYIDDFMPAWARPYVQKAKDIGLIMGDETGKLNLTDDKIFTIVLNLRSQGIMK